MAKNNEDSHKGSTPKKATETKKSSAAKKDTSVKATAKQQTSHKKGHNETHKKSPEAKGTHHNETHKKSPERKETSHSKSTQNHDAPSSNKNTILVGVGVGVVLILIALGFVLFSLYSPMEQGSTTSTSETSGGVVATVNGEEITSQEVDEIKQQLGAQQQSLSGNSSEVSQDEAVEQAVITTLLRQKVEEGGYMLSDEEVEQQLSSQIEGQGMSLDDYKSQLESQGSSYQDTIDEYKFQLGVQNYLEEAMGNRTPEVTEEEIQQYYEQYSQQTQGEVQPLEEVRDQLVQSIEQQKMGEVQNQFIQELLQDADVEYN